jgi:hypothetical protein
MIKKNLLKTVMLGLCMATLTTGSAYATLAEDTTPSASEEVSDQTNALYAKQGEIDKLLFEANAKEIERLGFMVNYTSMVEDYIEIGISPYNDDNANYIYELVGKDGVKVIEFDQSVLYASGAAPDTAAGEVVTDAEVIMDKEDTSADPDQVVTSDDAGVDDKEVQIQIESTTAEAYGEEKVYKNTSAEVDDVRTIAATDANEKDDVSTPIIVLSIVGGAALLGGAVLLTSKKKSSK